MSFKKVNVQVLALLTIALCIIFAYWKLPNTFFQQDEWQGFSRHTYFINKGAAGVIESLLPVDPLSHFAPLAALLSWFNYFFFKTNFALYAWQSIALHIFNASLLYFFVFFWFKRKEIAFIAALFFGVNSIPHQAVTWVAAANSYEVPAAFILLSLLFFQRFLSQEKYRKRNIFLSLTMLFVSLLFHENGIFLFLFYPIIFFLYAKPQWRKPFSTFSIGIICAIVIFFLVRIPFLFGFSNPLPEVTDITHPSIAVYPYRMISIGMKSFAGNFFPEGTLIDIANEVVTLAYPQFITPDRVPNPYIAQSIVFDLVSYVLTVVIALTFVLLVRLMRDKSISKGLTWTLIFIATSLLPYGFVLGKAGYASILDPKFFYIASIGLSILVALVVFSLSQTFSKSKPLRFDIYFLFFVYALWHVFAVKNYVHTLEAISVQRKEFLMKIKRDYQKLPQNVVFYTQSDTAYYGMPDNEKILPVQIGFGKMLMIWYQEEENFPGCMYEGNFLLPLLEEGYRNCQERGFGYFRHYDKLVSMLKEQNLPIENVIAYTWDGETLEFTDQTDVVGKQLAQDLKRQ